jgi:hypothetical protein
MVVLFGLFAIALLKNPSGAQLNIFFGKMNDFFADFFNVLRYIAGRDPYYNPINGTLQKIYFPLTYVILYPFSRLDNFGTMTLQETWASRVGLMSALFFTLANVGALCFFLDKIRRKYNLPLYVLIGLFLSYIFYFSVERGNIIILSAACVCAFLAYYDSNNKKEQIVAIVALSIAVTLKIYPVLFGFLYLEKKQYREIAASAVLTIILSILPFLFFKRGFANIPQLIQNQQDMAIAYNFTSLFPRFSLAHCVYYFGKAVGVPAGICLLWGNAANILIHVASIASIVLALLLRDKWTKTTLLAMVILFLPVNSGLYCGLYVLPCIILFFATLNERKNSFNIFATVVFIIFLNPFQLTFVHKDVVYLLNYILENIALLSLWLVLFLSSIKKIALEFKDRLQHQVIRK